MVSECHIALFLSLVQEYVPLSSDPDEDLDLPDYSVRKGKNKKQKVLFVYITVHTAKYHGNVMQLGNQIIHV